MDTQNTPVHPKLWHRDFWLLAVANMFLSMSAYMMIPILPQWLSDSSMNLKPLHLGMIMGAYGLGLFALGPACNYLVQKYRRNHVCIVSVFAMMLVSVGIFVCREKVLAWHLNAWCFIGLRFLLGAAFGMAQMVLSSTLIIDTCESFQRTEACYASSWFARFAMSLGPMLALVLHRYFYYDMVLVVILGLAALSVVLMQTVHFPFKAPDDTMKLVSCDRFFLLQGKWLFLNLMLITAVVGLIMTLPLTAKFYAMLMCGFFLALLAEKYAFANAELKSEAITGLILIGAALLMMINDAALPVVPYLAPVFVGFGIGLIGSRFLLFFIKLSLHCQRGTSQSTFFLAWELGISLGLFVGIAIGKQLLISLSLVFVSLLMYNFFTHPWYMKHKNR
ncbi:MAG: MFS transporter [Prevotella sp.]|nr:MFS transporter [Prevotella sp.]